jgi:hypothetical protein
MTSLAAYCHDVLDKHSQGLYKPSNKLSVFLHTAVWVTQTYTIQEYAPVYAL